MPLGPQGRLRRFVGIQRLLNDLDRLVVANERLDLGNFHNGVVSAAVLYDEVGRMKNGVSG